MQRQCSCGHAMKVKLRTIIYSNKVEIENVPIYSCGVCQRNEVLPSVKQDLTGIIGKLGSKPEKQQLLFQEYNEFAHIMYRISDYGEQHLPLEAVIENRVNELLDMMLLAQSLGDRSWIDQLRQRLLQITKHTETI